MAKRKRKPLHRPPAKQPREQTKPPFNHAEAFRLMKYHCRDCGHLEIIWNSRDGVTPFTLTCVACRSGLMEHIDWHTDILAVDHLPQPGQYVWIDMPDSLKTPLARARLASFAGTEFAVPAEHTEEFVKSLLESFHVGEPWLIQWPG